ncbi:hypothetical protein BASA81_007101 [Batrachochytrium salamandrivorans]|nr:hypothetical protein BASA81_007101 [Batrachochytrium salamandrivorans]
MCGKVFDVVPHERMQSRFKLTSNGEMVVSIRSLDRPANVSVITVDRPFPGEDESSFRSWLEFFAQKQSAGEIKAEGAFDIEYKADEVDLNALRHMCPLEIHHAQFHQHPRASSSQEFAQAGWEVRGMNFNTRAPMVRFG